MKSQTEEKCFNLDVLWKTIKINEKNSNSILNLLALAYVLLAHETICTKFSFKTAHVDCPYMVWIKSASQRMVMKPVE